MIELTPRQVTKLKKIEDLWVKAYDEIFSNADLYRLAPPVFLAQLKEAALEMQLFEVRTNFDTYGPISMEKIERSIRKTVEADSYKMVEDMIRDFEIDVPDDQCWSA